MRRTGTVGAAALTSPALLLLVAGPASAHDTVVPASPRAEQVLSEPPVQVRLTLAGTPQRVLGQVVVTDGAGADRGVGALELDGSQVVQALDGVGAPGLWRAAYRVVSSDGHPVSGEWTFDVRAAPTTAPPAAASPSTVSTPARDEVLLSTPSAAAPPAAAAGTPALTQDGPGLGAAAGWLGAALALLAVGTGVALRARRAGQRR